MLIGTWPIDTFFQQHPCASEPRPRVGLEDRAVSFFAKMPIDAREWAITDHILSARTVVARGAVSGQMTRMPRRTTAS